MISITFVCLFFHSNYRINGINEKNENDSKSYWYFKIFHVKSSLRFGMIFFECTHIDSSQKDNEQEDTENSSEDN